MLSGLGSVLFLENRTDLSLSVAPYGTPPEGLGGSGGHEIPNVHPVPSHGIRDTGSLLMNRLLHTRSRCGCLTLFSKLSLARNHVQASRDGSSDKILSVEDDDPMIRSYVFFVVINHDKPTSVINHPSNLSFGFILRGNLEWMVAKSCTSR